MTSIEGQVLGDHPKSLRARRLHLDTNVEMVVFMHRDCHICRSEGFSSHARVALWSGSRQVIATLYHVSDGLLHPDEAALSESAWTALGLADGDRITVTHPAPLNSLSQLRTRIYGGRLDESSFHSIIRDIVNGRYSDIHISSFLTACSAVPLDPAETLALTRAMIDVGDHLTWPADIVVDKHSIGGLAGNRTTPIVVPIVACMGLTMPKTSSRAITSPAGTADTMETLAPVDLDPAAIRRVVEQEGGCIVWGGAVRLSPADDILIRVERALDIDSEGQLIASSEESDRVVRLTRIQALADDVFADVENADRWLRQGLGILDGKSPLETARTEAGARLIEQILAKRDWGAAA